MLHLFPYTLLNFLLYRMCIPFKLVNHPRFAGSLIGSILDSIYFLLIIGSIIGSIILNTSNL